MEFELWLFAVKQLAQSYEVCQLIYSQLTQAEKDELRKEYERSVGGGSGKPENKVLKEYGDLINNFHNAMSIAERFVEKNTIRRMNENYPVHGDDPDEEFIGRVFLTMETYTIRVIEYLNHIAKKVSAEGSLKQESDGNYYLNNIQIKDGMLIEFFHLSRWEIGRLCNGPGTPYGRFFLGFNNEVFDVDLNGLKVRLRG